MQRSSLTTSKLWAPVDGRWTVCWSGCGMSEGEGQEVRARKRRGRPMPGVGLQRAGGG